MKVLQRKHSGSIKVKVDLKRLNDSDHWQWYTTFNGQPMQHNYWLYYVIDGIMANNPQIASIVEIGTAEGALSTVLGLWGVKKDIPVLTIDWTVRCDEQRRVFDRLDITFLNANVLIPDVQEQIVSFTNNKPVFLVVDGGHKPNEFNLYVPQIAVGSVIGVHDYGVEWFMHGIEDVAGRYCEKLDPDSWNKMNVQFATFKKARNCDVDKRG